MFEPFIYAVNLDQLLSCFIKFAIVNSMANSLPADMAGAKHRMKSISSSVG